MKSFLRTDFASVPGEETITPIPGPSVPIGQTDKMSKGLLSYTNAVSTKGMKETTHCVS